MGQLTIATDQRSLLTAAKLLATVADHKSTLPILGHVAMRSDGSDSLILCATDLGVSLTIRIAGHTSGRGGMAIPARALVDAVKALPGPDCTHRDGHADIVIREGGEDRILLKVGGSRETFARLMRELWVPLPADHERVRLWIRATYRHLRHCYRDDQRLATDERDNGMLIFPVPYYKLRTFQDDPRFSDAWRDAERAAVAAYNANASDLAAKVAISDNHCAVRRIREFYPDHMPEMDLIITNGAGEHEGDWWETEVSRPSIAECHPRNGIGARDHAAQWCQWCGRNAGES